MADDSPKDDAQSSTDEALAVRLGRWLRIGRAGFDDVKDHQPNHVPPIHVSLPAEDTPDAIGGVIAPAAALRALASPEPGPTLDWNEEFSAPAEPWGATGVGEVQGSTINEPYPVAARKPDVLRISLHACDDEGQPLTGLRYIIFTSRHGGSWERCYQEVAEGHAPGTYLAEMGGDLLPGAWGYVRWHCLDHVAYTATWRYQLTVFSGPRRYEVREVKSGEAPPFDGEFPQPESEPEKPAYPRIALTAKQLGPHLAKTLGLDEGDVAYVTDRQKSEKHRCWAYLLECDGEEYGYIKEFLFPEDTLAYLMRHERGEPHAGRTRNPLF